jgi:PAS domain S-box-containing protein
MKIIFLSGKTEYSEAIHSAAHLNGYIILPAGDVVAAKRLLTGQFGEILIISAMSLSSNQEMDDFIIDLVSIRQIPIIIYADSSIYNGIICNEILSLDLTAEDLKSAITNCRNRYINQQKIIGLLINQRKFKQKISLLEKRWDDFIYKNTAPIYQHDVNGKLLKPNDAMWKMFDYDPNDPEKPKNIDDFIIHEQYDYKLERIKKIINDGELNQPGLYNLRKKDGSIITVETRSIVLENDNNEKFIQGIVLDVSKSHQLLMEQEERLREQELLVDVARNYFVLDSPEEILDYITPILFEQSKATYMIVSGYSSERNGVVVREVAGLTPFAKSLLEKLNFNPIGLKVDYDTITDEEYEKYTCHRLMPIDLHRLSGGNVPKLVTDAITAALHITEVTTLGLSYKGKLYGGITFVMTHNNKLQNHYLIETLINQTSTVIQRRLMDEDKIHSEAQFRLLFNSLHDGVTLNEMKYDAGPGKIVEVNEAFTRITGFSHDELLNFSNPMDIVVDGSANMTYGEMLWRVRNGSIVKVEMKLLHKNKSEIPVEVTFQLGNFHGKTVLLSVFHDISDRIEAQDKLEDEKEKLLATVQSLNDAIIAVDNNEIVTFINRAAENWTGWSNSEAEGHNINEIIHFTDHKNDEKIVGLMLNALKTGGELIAEEPIKLIDLNGKEHLITYNFLPIKRSNIKSICAMLVMHDVTMEVQLRNELNRSNRMESIGVLAGGIAHDFNNLLTSISGNMGLAQINLDDNDIHDARECMREAEDAAMQARGLTQQLLTFSRGGAPVLAKVDMPALVKESAKFALTGSSNISKINIDKDVWSIHADHGQISQVLNNLILNADQAMDTAGVVEITVKNVVLGSDEGLPLKEGKYLYLSIEDNGKGISPEISEKIFDPFFTTKSHGNGLGLSSVYSIVKAHDGYINFNSSLGNGSIFYLYLPVNAGENITDTDEEQIVVFDNMPLRRILVMDDEKSIRNITRQVLNDMGHQVTLVRNGEEAMEAVTAACENRVPYDIIVLDLTIPGGKGGADIVNEIKLIDPQVKIIASSGYATDPVMAKYDEFGFDDRLTKPYRLHELRSIIVKNSKK